jgi:hypothetical protein
MARRKPEDFADHFDPDRTSHRQFFIEALKELESHEPDALQPGHRLYDDFWLKKEQKPATTQEGIILAGFPYFSQLDNGPDGWRQCQTSAIAMCLCYLGLGGIKDDLDYLKVVQRHGDTTVQAAHQKALAELKVSAVFRTNVTTLEIKAELRAGRPVAAGLLHRGTPTRPTGGGHYVAIKGYTNKAWLVNDPYGSVNLVSGGWSAQGGTSGKDQSYSFANTNNRFLDGEAGGWAWLFPGRKG